MKSIEMHSHFHSRILEAPTSLMVLVKLEFSQVESSSSLPNLKLIDLTSKVFELDSLKRSQAQV